MTVYVLLLPTLPQDIETCQYRGMSKSLVVLDPAETAACCSPLSVQALSIQQAEQVARAEQIIDFAPGSYLVSYFDVSSSFAKSQQGYGGPGHSGGDGDALVHIVDVGAFDSDPVHGDLCANIYVFDDDQEMQECCSCPLTADSVQTFSTINDLTSNPQFSSPLGVGVIKIVSSGIEVGVPPFDCSSGGNGKAGTAGTIGANLGHGLEAWINHTESMASNNPSFTPPFGFVTSTSVTEFHHAPIDIGELDQLGGLCLNIELHASGRGICRCGIGS